MFSYDTMKIILVTIFETSDYVVLLLKKVIKVLMEKKDMKNLMEGEK